MKKIILSLVCLAFALIVVKFLFPMESKSKSASSFTIGVIAPLSGAVAADGEEALIGMKIAIGNLNLMGLGDYQLSIKDGKFEPKETLMAYNALVAEKVDAILAVGDVSCQMIEPRLEKDHIVALAPMASSEQSVNQSEWMFRSWLPIVKSSKIMAKYLRTKKIAQRAAIFSIDTMYGTEAENAFTRIFEENEGVITCKEKFPFLASDLRSSIVKVLNSNPEIIYVAGFGPTYVVAINQLRELGYNGILALDAAIADPRVKKNIKTLEKIIFIGSSFHDEFSLKNNETLDFIDSYKKMTSREEEEIPPQAPFSYFAVKVVGMSLSQAGRGERLKDAIGKLRNCDSVFGKFSYAKNRELIVPVCVKEFLEDGTEHTLNADLWKDDND